MGINVGSVRLLTAGTLTISAGVITPSRGMNIVASESSITDNLDTITTSAFVQTTDGADSYEPSGYLRAQTGHTITITNGVGNIITNSGASATLTDSKCLPFIKMGSTVFVLDSASGSIGMTDFLLTADTGTPEAVTDGDTVTIAGGTGIDTVIGATNTVTVTIDSTVATLTGTQTLTNKTIDGDNNTVQDLGLATLKTVGANINRFITRDGSGAVADGTAPSIDGGLTLNGAVVINEVGADTDTRIEGDTDANLFFADASVDGIGIGTNTPNASAKLDIVSTTKGFGLPSMTTAQRTAISTPRDGLTVYDADLDLMFLRANGAWGAIGSKVSFAQVIDEKTSGTNGGAATASAWTTRTLNTERFDPDGIVSLSSNEFVLGAGTYIIKTESQFLNASSRTRVYNATDATVVGYSGTFRTGLSLTTVYVSITTTKNFRLEYHVPTSGGSTDLGSASSVTSVPEIYSLVSIWKVA